MFSGEVICQFSLFLFQISYWMFPSSWKSKETSCLCGGQKQHSWRLTLLHWIFLKKHQHSNLTCLKYQCLEPKDWVLEGLMVNVSGASACQIMPRVHGPLLVLPEVQGSGGDRESRKASTNLSVYIIRTNVVGRERTGDKGKKSPVALSEAPSLTDVRSWLCTWHLEEWKRGFDDLKK